MTGEARGLLPLAAGRPLEVEVPIDSDTFSDWGTVYAAIVATGALFLEVRRWFESGPKLVIDANPNVKRFPPGPKDHTYIAIQAMNRGASATTLTNLIFEDYTSWWRQLLRPSEGYMTIVGASPEQPLPFLLPPGGQWMGRAIQSKELDEALDRGRLCVTPYGSHSARPAHVRVRRRRVPEGKPVAGPS